MAAGSFTTRMTLTGSSLSLDGYNLGANHHILLGLQADAQLAIGRPEAAFVSVAVGLKAVEKMGGSAA
jgi:hypothetical protein